MYTYISADDHSDIHISCLYPNSNLLTVPINEQLSCRKYGRNKGIIQNLVSIEQSSFIAFRIAISIDSQLIIVSAQFERWIFSFSATNLMVQFFHQSELNGSIPSYIIHTSDILLLPYQIFWISWSTGHFIVGMGDTVNHIDDIVVDRLFIPIEDLMVEYAVYQGSDWTFYDYPTSKYCEQSIMTRIISKNILPYSYSYQINSNSNSDLNFGLWYSQYVLFELISNSTAYISVQRDQINETIKFVFQNHECESLGSSQQTLSNITIDFQTTHPITIIQETGNENETGSTHSLYCSLYSEYDISSLSCPCPFWIWWNDSLLLFGDGEQVGNGIIFSLTDDFLTNPVDNMQLASIEISDWIFYSASRSIIGRPSTSIPTSTTPTYDRSIIINRDEILFCKKYYTHSNSKSDIDTLNTMNDHFIAFSVKNFDDDSSPQLILSHWDLDEDKNRGSSQESEADIDDAWWWSIELEITKQVLIVSNNTNIDIAQTIFPSKFRIQDMDNCYLDITYGAFTDNNDKDICCQDHGLFDQEKNLFWNCETLGPIWSYDHEIERVYYEELGLFVKYGERGYGFQITDSDRNAKVTPYDIGDHLNIVSSTEPFRYKMSFMDPILHDNCHLAKDDEAHVYMALDGQTFLFGYEAKFKCGGSGAVDVKLVIAPLADVMLVIGYHFGSHF